MTEAAHKKSAIVKPFGKYEYTHSGMRNALLMFSKSLDVLLDKCQEFNRA